MNQAQENYENQQMQEALEHVSDYIAWVKSMEPNIEEKDETLEALIAETVELDNEYKPDDNTHQQ